jgi:hypothetical protein
MASLRHDEIVAVEITSSQSCPSFLCQYYNPNRPAGGFGYPKPDAGIERET